MSLIEVSGGRIYDPLHTRNGEIGSVWIRDGKVIEAPGDSGVRADRVIDATGMVVMPGGIDMHCHIAGSKVNAARALLPEMSRRHRPLAARKGIRSGTTGPVPSTFATGALYAGLGYTTAFDAAISPLHARHALEEMHDTPFLDKGYFILVGNNQLVMRELVQGTPESVRNLLSWLIRSTRGYALKLVNPGGVEMWKQNGSTAKSLDDHVPHFDITPREILRGVTQAANDLDLPHPVHIHCNQLGMPGNVSTTLETMQALDGLRAHLTHIQFHSYGGDADDQSTFCAGVEPLVEYVNGHPNLTVDVGQVMFGETVSMTGDGPLGHFLGKLFGKKWVSVDVELESGCGVTPIVYKRKSLVHALQWAIGLEWYLLMEDPWRIAMSTDHPNGASFMAYPEIIALLMDRSRRQELLNTLPDEVTRRCLLGDLTREYTLEEIAIITRAAPARILGLTHKGHLGVGADGDVTIYQPDDDVEKMFAFPRYVLRRGEVLVDDGELKAAPDGELLHVTPDFDESSLPRIQAEFERHSSIQFHNFAIREEEEIRVRR